MNEATEQRPRVAVLTSGGDAPGMNAAVRAVVRTGLEAGAEVFSVREGYLGLVEGRDPLVATSWDDVGGILYRGGTVIGTGRSSGFRTLEGRQRAARVLVASGVDRMVVIGGDGSLEAAAILHREWHDHLEALVAEGAIDRAVADRHPHLVVAGLAGSIDNDVAGTDITIGADTALHRITEAVDAIGSTATSHQRTFVVEVMGRHCGYLAVMGALATGADWVLIPESPPETERWDELMAERLRAGRRAGRRDSIVIVAEGARDREGRPISSMWVRERLEQLLGEEVRLTILGHVQRGGAPSAYDRYMSSVLGHAAVREVLSATPGSEPVLVGLRSNRVSRSPLSECVARTRAVSEAIESGDFATALSLRGHGFKEALRTLRTLVRIVPRPPQPGQRRLRLGVLNAGGLAPGMNTAVRVAVRLGLDAGHVMLGVRNGFAGLAEGLVEELGWMSMRGWAGLGGSELGTNRQVPAGRDLYAIARSIERHEIDGLLVIGGWSAYEAVHRLFRERDNFPAFNLPVVCLPATIDNNLPGAEISIGADTALNSIVGAVDKIKQSAVANRRCFVVEVMGRSCGFLALMSGLATGAEQVYLAEEGISIEGLQRDLAHLKEGFRRNKRLGLVIRNEAANPVYTTPFMVALFAEEGGELFEVRQAILGHLQQGGNPSPFDRIQASRMAAIGIEQLMVEALRGGDTACFVGRTGAEPAMYRFDDFTRMADGAVQRPREQWWMELRPVVRLLAQSAPHQTVHQPNGGVLAAG